MFYFIFIFACFLSCIFHYRFQTKMCIVAWVIKQRQQYVLALFTQCLHCSTCFICCFIYIKLYLFIYMYMRVRLNWIKKDEEDQFPKFLFLSFSEKKKALYFWRIRLLPWSQNTDANSKTEIYTMSMSPQTEVRTGILQPQHFYFSFCLKKFMLFLGNRILCILFLENRSKVGNRILWDMSKGWAAEYRCGSVSGATLA